MRLRRYWITFVQGDPRVPGYRYYGVTGFDWSDSIRLLEERLFRGPLPPVGAVVEDVDVSQLDADHILPNIGPSAVRGVWYPWIG